MSDLREAAGAPVVDAPAVVEPVLGIAESGASAASPAVPASEVLPSPDAGAAVAGAPDALPGDPETPASAHDAPTLLEAGAKTEAVEIPAEALAAGAEPAVVVPPVEPIAYELAVPEGFTVEPERMTELNALFNEARVPPEQAGKLWAMHTDAMTRVAEHLASEQHRVWSATRSTWVKEVLSDPEIGGAGHDTAMQQIATARDRFVPAAERAAFDEFLRTTGAGDHPAFLRMLYRAGAVVNEPANSAPPSIRPPPAPRAQRGMRYDHPTSGRHRGA